MTENAKRKSHTIGIASVFATAALLTYGASIFISGNFRDFCENAVGWVLAGIAIAAYFACCAKNR